MIGKLRNVALVTLVCVFGVGLVTTGCTRRVSEEQMRAMEELQSSIESLKRQIRDCEQEQARLKREINQKKDELASIQRDLDAMGIR
jgi:septal ring factor EnvC (AmiA/AmiB activator)